MMARFDDIEREQKRFNYEILGYHLSSLIWRRQSRRTHIGNGESHAIILLRTWWFRAILLFKNAISWSSHYTSRDYYFRAEKLLHYLFSLRESLYISLGYTKAAIDYASLFTTWQWPAYLQITDGVIEISLSYIWHCSLIRRWWKPSYWPATKKALFIAAQSWVWLMKYIACFDIL